MSDVKKKSGDNDDISLDSLLTEFLSKENTAPRFRAAKDEKNNNADSLSSTRAFDIAKIPEEDQNIKENVKEFEESVKKYFSENHETDVDKTLTQLYDPESETNEDYIGTEPGNNPSRFSGEEEPLSEDLELPEEPERDNIDKRIDLAFSDQYELYEGDKKSSASCDCGKFKFEYTSPCQDMEITKTLQKCTLSAFKSMSAVLLFTLISIYTEFAPILNLPHFRFVEPGKYSSVFSLISLQLLFLCVIFSMDSIFLGIKNLFSGHPTPESAAFVIALVTSIQAVASVFMKYDSSDLTVYCSLGCFSILLMSLYEYWKSRSLLMSFKVVSVKKPKFGTEKLNFDSSEGEAFMKYLSDGSEIFTTKQEDFVNHFFARSQARSKSDKKIGGLLITGFLFGLLFGVLNYIFKKDVYTSLNIFTATLLTTVPASIYMISSLPFFIASKKAFQLHSAFIGLSAGDYYEKASVISFDDTAVFPPKQVKVTSIKTYGKNRIDNVIITMARIFGKLGGPLSDVFEKSVSNLRSSESCVTLVETAPDGLRLSIDEDDYLVGLGSFMQFYGIDTPPDSIDDSFIQSSGSVLYLAVNNELAAKFYIKYTINNQFESLLRSLYNAGICTGIKTIDPCISNELVCANLKHSNYPISVLKCKNPDQLTQDETEPFDTGVVSASGISNFLKVFVLANKLRLTIKSNTFIKFISIIIGLAILGFFVATGNVTEANVSFLLLFQIFWLLPVSVISYLSK